jgi:phosphoglycerate dehydrogenase-like enzyme
MYVPWERLFEDADVLTVHARLTDTSRGWITFDELSKMKRTAYLINTARSALIDQEDLLRALRTGVIAGAGLDVYDQEPLPLGHPLLTLGNVVLTPHLGYATVETLTEFYEQVIANIKAWRDGYPTNVLNPEAFQSVS